MDSSLTTDTPTSLRRWLLSEQAQTDLAAVANGTMSGFRLANILYQCVNRTPQLTACTLPDLFTAARTLVILGCEPDNVHGYLVPRNIKTPNGGFRTIPVPIPSARGLVRTARANGVRNLNIGAVYAGDTFEWSISGGRFNYSHTSAWEPSGELCGFYCTWEDKDGYLHGVRMSVSEVNDIRARSDAYRRAESKGTGSSPWHTDYEQMALKTVIKRAAKQWDMPIEFQQALQDADTVECGTDKEAMRNVTRRRTALEEELPSLTPAPAPAPEPAPAELPTDQLAETLFPLPAEDETPQPAYRD